MTQQTVQLPTQQNVEASNQNGNERSETIRLHPLRRMILSILQPERSEAAERRRIRQIFNDFDRDGDGYLGVMELKQLQRHNGDHIPKGVERQILKIEDGDGRLDFEEFFAMSQDHNWSFKGFVVKYCQIIVPSPHREDEDEDVDDTVKLYFKMN